jgi:hypothetical protein
MEFLRYGSRIPGSNIGCCGWDIIQDFKQDPDAAASIQLVSGDGGSPCLDYSRKPVAAKHLGKTWREIFNARMRIGTFNTSDMPNHGFLAILTGNQLQTETGKKWLAILKAHGFKFMCGVQNSVYSFSNKGHECYLFALPRNVGKGGIDPYTPPKEWTDLPEPEGTDKDRWEALPKVQFYFEEDLHKEGIPVWTSGVKGTLPRIKKPDEKKEEAPNPFGTPVAA